MNIQINTCELDLYKSDANAIIKNHGVIYDNVCCHFAIHYFFKSREIFQQLINIVSSNIKVGGKFIVTFMLRNYAKDLNQV